MDNQALGVLVAVALFGALAIGIISVKDTRHSADITPRYTSNYDASRASN